MYTCNTKFCILNIRPILIQWIIEVHWLLYNNHGGTSGTREYCSTINQSKFPLIRACIASNYKIQKINSTNDHKHRNNYWDEGKWLPPSSLICFFLHSNSTIICVYAFPVLITDRSHYNAFEKMYFYAEIRQQ